MEITTDIALRSTAWDQAIDALSPLFKPRSQYSIYMLALSIGIMYDRRIVSDEDYRHSVPRNVLQNNDNGKLDFMFQAAILSTTTESFTEDERLELAFGEKTDFKKIDFLTQFANFGVTKLVEHIGASPIESMENIKNFLAATVEGNNFDIDALPDDLLMEDV
jgi:hypothetical protein